MSWRPETLRILHHPHPALSFASTPVASIDPEFKRTIAEMFELMYAAEGIGLAANQVGIPKRFFVLNLTADADEKEEEFVFINPTIRSRRGADLAEEGCLSLPGLYGDVRRPSAITVEAYGLDGQPFEMKIDDLPARAVQHEVDHLDGTMFIDKVSDAVRAEIAPKVEEFEIEHRSRQSAGELDSDASLTADLKRMAIA